MIFIFPQWRFGNQVFQYMFAKYIAKENEKIVTTMAPYFDIIEESKEKFFLIPNKKFFRYINFWLNKLFLILAKFRIINYIKQKKIRKKWFLIETKWYKESKWIFSFVKYIDWFFIYEWDHIKDKTIQIKNIYLNKAKKILEKLPKNNFNIFIHIRRWDYLEWSVMWTNNLSLPIEYYKKQINYFIDKYKNTNFVFLSDDINWCKKEFYYLKNSYFSENDLWIDFALMILCDWAIISPSTLSYLWAYFMNNKIEVFAPNYFLGFKVWTWYPDWIFTNKINFLKIK